MSSNLSTGQSLILCKDNWNLIIEHSQDLRPLALTCKSLYGIIAGWCNNKQLEIQSSACKFKKFFHIHPSDKLTITRFMRSIQFVCAEFFRFGVLEASLISDIIDDARSLLYYEDGNEFSYANFTFWSQLLEQKIQLYELEDDYVFGAELFFKYANKRDMFDFCLYDLPTNQICELLYKPENSTMLETLTTIKFSKDFGRGTALRYLTNLENLTSEAKVLCLPDTITYLTNLKYLELSQSHLPVFPRTILQLSQLSTLIIFNSHPIEFLSEVNFNSLANLQKLNLLNCGLENLPATIFQLTNLTSLNFNLNSIKSIPAQIKNLTNLCEFSIADNKLEEISNELFVLPSLHTLNAQGTFLKEFPENLSLSSSLANLYFTRGKLKHLPPIHIFSNLSYLGLARNKLKLEEQVVRQLACLTHLKTVYLQENNSEALSKNFIKEMESQSNPVIKISDYW